MLFVLIEICYDTIYSMFTLFNSCSQSIPLGAIQDLDVGVVVGKGRTFGKGLVQNVQDLPYQTGK